jgi:hypothetical protein
VCDVELVLYERSRRARDKVGINDTIFFYLLGTLTGVLSLSF